MRYRAVCFDLDGTLLDTLADLAAAGNTVLADQGWPVHPVDAYRTFVGDGLATLVERMIPEAFRNQENVAALVPAFEQAYGRNWHERTRPYPGIAELLDQLTDRGLPLSILSNKPDAFTRLCVERLLGAWRFAPLFGQRPGVPKKPDPAGALAIAQTLGLAPSAVLYVGDSGVDMRTANAAGMDAVGVLWGFRDAEELRRTGARYLISRPQELLDILTGCFSS